MILEQGEKVHIVERRHLEDDIRRHMTGEVLKCSERAIRLKGYVWVFDSTNGRFVQKPEMRERVVCMGDRLIINVLPVEADLEATQYVTDPQKGLQVTDKKSFSLEITEFSPMR
jgi:hypothetical protein